nr:MAG TPA: YtxH-like protein [Caudoviricetes sp.]
MNKIVSFGLGMVVGGAISAAVSWKYFKDKSDREIEEIKERFREKEEDLSTEIQYIKDQKLEIMAQEAESQMAKDEEEVKPKKSKKKSTKKDAEKPISNATAAEDRPEMEYTDYAAISAGKDEEEEEKPKKKTTKKKSTKKKKEAEVVVITEEEWVDNAEDMTQITLYITPAAFVINGSTEQRIDAEGSIGQEMVDNFLESGDPVWYIRNNKLGVMYELVLDEDGDYDVY